MRLLSVITISVAMDYVCVQGVRHREVRATDVDSEWNNGGITGGVCLNEGYITTHADDQ